MSSISISKYQNLYHQITPAKVTVPHDINSWLETHSKQKLAYKYKPRKTLKKVDQNSHENQQNQPKLTNLAELRAYRQKLLKSSAKKMSDRCIPSPYSHANYSLGLLKSKRSGLNMKIRSLSRPRQDQKEHIIEVTQFEPNDGQPAPTAQLNLNFKFHNKMDRIIVKTLNNQRETTLLRRRKTISRKSLKNNPEMSIGFPYGIPNPQEKGIGLMSRRLLPSKA